MLFFFRIALFLLIINYLTIAMEQKIVRGTPAILFLCIIFSTN